jgi:hypothetical protein
MRLLSGALVLAVAALLCIPASRADAAFSDKLCPEATQYVLAVGAVSQNDTPQKQYDALHAAVNAYDTCGKRHLASAEIEPGVHYAYTRQASFGVVEARALLALNRTADAKRELENSKRLAQDVVEWKQSYNQSGANIASSGSDNRPSIYRDAAKEVLAAANDMLAKLAAPAASAIPAPAPSPHA